MRASSWPPEQSNRHSSIFSACAEKIAKLTPSPSQVAPSGYGRPGHTFHGDGIEDQVNASNGLWPRLAELPLCLGGGEGSFARQESR
jgi:hypothetical protein